jgi:hypothetical protein
VIATVDMLAYVLRIGSGFLLLRFTVLLSRARAWSVLVFGFHAIAVASSVVSLTAKLAKSLIG